MNSFEKLESQVRTYSRVFPAVFNKAKGPFLYDEDGKEYIDFFAGAGTLNYGHNNPTINNAVIEYIKQDRIIHSLDKWTTAKRVFLEKLDSIILAPRNFQYKIQFCGPTGANGVEAALKLARKAKKRRGVIAFTNAFHGLSMGALSVTGNAYYKNEFSINSVDVAFMPYDGYLGANIDTAEVLRKFLTDKSSGVEVPAAIILETIQAEGGVNVASIEWLKEIEKICREFDIVLIIDDIQVGNGRSSDFFSFERAQIKPDIVALSKAIGAGMPLSILLIKPELDIWQPGEHTGTFRGNNLAFLAGAKALEYWETDEFSNSIKEKSKLLKELLERTKSEYQQLITEIRGYGLIYGIVIPEEGICARVLREAFDQGLVIELAGPNNEVLKFLPPLTIDHTTLKKGVDIIEQSIAKVASN
ncbi:MAG: diaminobutyrate--2-oxoglutarate transaminase [Desulfobacteraceae bacterium]|nr:diaminobutyrate--2-oxoglutarate transaminase [Desulfobacteraceae bacterium]